MDLKAAYKQLARKPAHAHLSIIAIWNCNLGCVEFFELVALPFGATASVRGFNWASKLIRKIAVRVFRLLCSVYVDDFPCLEDADLAETSQACFEGFLNILGWKFADSAKKRVEFRPVFRMLGLEVDLTCAYLSKIVVRNTTSRIKEVSEKILSVLSKNALRPHQATGLRGRFGFAYSYFLGRPLALARS